MKIKAGKIERIPIKYSEELWRVVTWMLQINPIERPSIDDLMNLPHISLRLREKRLVEHHSILKKREEDIKEREKNVERKE